MLHFCPPKRSAFSLLETLIAMGLLAALLSVGWSLLGTYRDAEQRGWVASNQMETIRLTRQWLEQDIAALVDLGTHFSGSESGFFFQISPSINPLPFLAEAFQARGWTREGEGTEEPFRVRDQAEFDDGAVPDATATSPWPAERLDVEYKLQTLDGQPDSMILVRREYASADDSRGPRSSNDSLGELSSGAAEEPTLTLEDLYRAQEETQRRRGRLVGEQILPGLRRARLAFWDGSRWQSSFIPGPHGQRPGAICLEFDLDANQDLMRGDHASTSHPRNGSDMPQDRDEIATWQIDSWPSNSTEEILETDQQVARDVRIVVQLPTAAGNRVGVE